MFQQAYSLDLRKRVTRAIAKGKSCRAAAEQFEVSAATAYAFDSGSSGQVRCSLDLSGDHAVAVNWSLFARRLLAR
uniref:Transposase n=1 Tax=Ochrobactrum sp. LM19 TaxID=1449781 RepID=A0A0D5A0J8_9HYPH|nr:hypothetical protein [Ochrobactrum sp. LM19]AJW29939.1 transposase [Ochrobactrum sp. LM19]